MADKDVEMKDASKEVAKDKKEEKPAEEVEVNDPFFNFKRVMILMEKAAKEKDYKLSAALTKKYKPLRKELSLGDVMLLLEFFLPELFKRIGLVHEPTKVENKEEKLHFTTERASTLMSLPETQLYLYNLLMMKLIDAKDYQSAKDFGDFIYARIKDVNMRTMDHMGAKSMYLIGVVYEKLNILPQVRPMMLEAYKTCCLKLDQIGQATITNVIIRSFLSQNLYEQARNFIAKTSFPEHASNNQFARYLYYLGRIKVVQLEYNEAQARLVNSLRRGPEVGARGFRIQVQKLQVICELLMGEIPSRMVFQNPEYKKALWPYLQIVTCVKQGDMDNFKKIVSQYQETFMADKNYSLVLRLKHTVIKFGLKKLNISYSKISIADIQKKLSLESQQETEQIVAKAIRDGVIEAQISHDDQFMASKEIIDVYTSNEPQQMLHKRIKFCMDLHEEAVKGLEFPPVEDKRDFGDLDEERSTKEEDLLG
jgi:26S proteasome regulatory subunit N3